MNYTQNLLRFAIIAILTLFAFGPSGEGQAAPSNVEPHQFSCVNVTEIPQIECEALVALYNGTDGPNWITQTDWLVTNTTCSWYGITCTNGRVTTLHFYNGNNLSGDVPSAIGNLTNLTKLDFNKNQLSDLPPEIGNLSNLTSLNLGSNQLSSLPVEIGNLSNLRRLELYSTHLSSLPTEIGNLSNLTSLNLNSSQLSSLPIEIGNLINLTSLALTYNQLSSLPTEIGNLSNLTILNLGSNQLSSLPTEIGNLSNLTILNLGSNQLSSLPTEIGNLSNLTHLYLANNQLSSLPTEIGNLSNLTDFYLSNNQLRNLPPDIGDLTNLTTLNLSSNQLSGLPAEIGNLSNLPSLYLNSNRLNSLPPEIGNLSVRYLNLSSNQLSSLPSEIGNLTNLAELDLNSNRLSSLTTEIGNLSKLTWLDLFLNRLNTLPSEIGNLSNLRYLNLPSNRLSSLPAEFTNLVSLSNLNISDNHLINLSTEQRTFLDRKDPDWVNNQTAPPTATLMPTDTPPPTATVTATPTSTSTPANTSTPTPLPEDEREPDNNCTDATTIQINGSPQTHTLHTPTDTDWTTFTAPTPGTYRIEVNIPKDSRADVDLYYYTACDSFHEESFTETFSPGARLDVEAERAGQQFYINVKNFDALTFGPDVTYNLSVRQMPSQQNDDGGQLIPGPAIVVAGRYRGTDSVQDNIDQTALAAYDLFVAKGRKDSEIFFLTTNSSLSDNVDGEATERNLEHGITEWAKAQLEKENVAQVLTLYLVDHGGPDEFYLDRLNEEVLTPNDLDAWLSTLEAEFPDLLVNVIIEACRAGSFIERRNGSISKPGRVIITSSSASYDAFVSRYGAHFSDNFLTFLLQEQNLGYSFQESRNIVQRFHSRQDPWIDADGDGEPNELNDIAQASRRGFAQAGTLGGEWPPYIAAVNASPQGTDLVAEVRHKGGNQDIEAVWAVVYPPSYTPPTGQAAYEDDGELNVETLDVIEFQADGESNYVESEAYTGFTEAGVYRVVVHARDTKGLVAQSVTFEVDTRHWVYLPMISR